MSENYISINKKQQEYIMRRIDILVAILKIKEVVDKKKKVKKKS